MDGVSGAATSPTGNASISGSPAKIAGESSYPSPPSASSDASNERQNTLGSRGNQRHRQQQQQQLSPQQQSQPSHLPQQPQQFQHGYVGGNNYRGRHFYNQQHRQFQRQRQIEGMTEEEKQKYFARQEKVNRITRASGFMNPRDKDFVTRFQLSQIVTDDPYNEDFYCQVYKVLNSSVEENSMNSLAKKYLEQSGHRLGGRSKRADIALQRMQQQVSKAVSVAKERGKRTGVLSKEGALGKVSFASGKQPRQMLVVNSSEPKAGTDEVAVEYKFPQSSRTFRLSIVEKIYSEVLKLESTERESGQVDDTELWNSLKANQSEDASADIDPFISVLSFDKMMKVFNRVFHLLAPLHRAELVELIFRELHKVEVVHRGSYELYANKKYELPKEVKAEIEMFQTTILKALVLYLSESQFSIVLHFLDVLVENNTIPFLVTTRIGLSLITVLISRLELIKQEMGSGLGAQDLSHWQRTYDKLFQFLEGRITIVFPPYFSNDEQKMVRNSDPDDNDSYIWEFLASFSLAGQLSHQRIVVDEVRDEIFGAMATSKKLREAGDSAKADKRLSELNLFLNVIGLKANEDDITELAD